MSPQTPGIWKPKDMSWRERIRRSLLFGFLLLFPITFNYYSPALPIQGTFERIATFSLLFWTLWFITSLIFGRAACGYICPLGALQELWDHSIKKRLHHVRNLSIIKYVIFALWIAMILMAAINSGGWNRIDLTYETENIVSWDSWDRVFIYIGMFGLVMIFCLPMGRRAFCHYICWWAPLNIIGTKTRNRLNITPALCLEANKDACLSCGICTRGCTMSLPVREMVLTGHMDNTECILCGKCTENCTENAIKYSWKRPERVPPKHQGHHS